MIAFINAFRGRLVCTIAATLLAVAARGQEYDGGLDPLPYRLPAEVEPTIVAEGDARLQAGYIDSSATDDRLAALEAEVRKLTSADAKRKADAAKKPTFIIGGQLQ